MCNEEMATAAPSVIYVGSIQVEEKKKKEREFVHYIAVICMIRNGAMAARARKSEPNERDERREKNGRFLV